MATVIKIPKLGLSDETALIGEWHKNEGEQVSAGEVILTIETEKACFDIESEVDGTLLAILVEEGEEVPVLIDACIIGEEGEDISEWVNWESSKSIDLLQLEDRTSVPNDHEANEQSSEDTKILRSEENSFTNSSSSVKISPRAKRAAERLHIDYRLAEPTGTEGRIIERDIWALQDKIPKFTSAAKSAGLIDHAGSISGTGLGGRVTTQDLSTKDQHEGQTNREPSMEKNSELSVQEYEMKKLSQVRKIVSKTMMKSLQSTAQLTLTSSFDATAILQFRERVKNGRELLGLENITLNDIIIFAVSRALSKHKALNAHMVDEHLLEFQHVHLGMAVDTDRGLFVPTLFHSDQLSLNQIADKSKALIQKCKEGTILPDEMSGGTFTITNLGSLGIESFTPILNPPQVGILGINTIVERIKRVNGQETTYPAIGLSLTFDHRALDGAPAARFLYDLKHYLEHIDLLLAK